MKLNNPAKFLSDSSIDPTLIARGEVKIQASIDGTNWNNNINTDQPWQYIRFSFDNRFNLVIYSWIK